MIVTLTGFMGSGKSSVGKVLAERLSCPFADLDSLIEDGERRSIPDIFASDGEPAFRSLELKYLAAFLSDHDFAAVPAGLADKQASPKGSPMLKTVVAAPATLTDKQASPKGSLMPVPTTMVDSVLALGGGTLTTEECAKLVKDKTFCIYLRATTDTLVENLTGGEEGRPMLKGDSLRERIEELMAEREAMYEGTAHATIDTDGQTYDETADAILSILTASSISK